MSRVQKRGLVTVEACKQQSSSIPAMDEQTAQHSTAMSDLRLLITDAAKSDYGNALGMQNCVQAGAKKLLLVHVAVHRHNDVKTVPMCCSKLAHTEPTS